MSNAFQLAAQQIGLNENDQRVAVQEYLSNGGQNLDPTVTAWCAAFVNATLQQSGMEGTNALNARSYLDWGQEVTDPQQGDIAVFSRGDPNGWKGHVGFFDGYNDDGSIRVLGGNQSDGVNIASYGADRLLGFRRAADGSQAPQTGGYTTQAPVFAPMMPQAATQAPMMTPEQLEQNRIQTALAAMPEFQTNALNAEAFQTQPRQNALAQYGFGQGQSPFL